MPICINVMKMDGIQSIQYSHFHPENVWCLFENLHTAYKRCLELEFDSNRILWTLNIWNGSNNTHLSDAVECRKCTQCVRCTLHNESFNWIYYEFLRIDSLSWYQFALTSNRLLRLQCWFRIVDCTSPKWNLHLMILWNYCQYNVFTKCDKLRWHHVIVRKSHHNSMH